MFVQRAVAVVLAAAILQISSYTHAQSIKPTAGFGGGSVTGATAQATPADPAATSSLDLVMAGFAISITPTSSGKILLVGGGAAVNSTGANAAMVQLSYGTGTAPVNGAAVTGTQVGNLVYVPQGVPGGEWHPFSINAIVTLTPGTPYWLDFAYKSFGGGASSLTTLSISAIEIP